MLTTKHQSSQVRRRELIDEARKIIGSMGMESLTIRNLARAVGISEGDIYRHFKSKNEILVGLLDEVGEVIEELVRVAEEGDKSPLEKLEALLKGHLYSAEQRQGVSFMAITEVLGNGHPDLRPRVQTVINSYLAKVVEILEDGVHYGQINPKCNRNAAAILFFGLIQGAGTVWHFAGPEPQVPDRYQELWQTYRDGIVCPS